MLYKKYNEEIKSPESAGRFNRYYLSVKFKLYNYDNAIRLSIQPVFSDGTFEEYACYTGTSLSFGFLKRKNEKVQAMMEAFIEPHLDKLANMFTVAEEYQKKNTPPGENYIFIRSKSPELEAEMLSIKDNFIKKFGDKLK